MKQPFFRLMSKLFGETKYIDEHLEDMAKKFGGDRGDPLSVRLRLSIGIFGH